MHVRNLQEVKMKNQLTLPRVLAPVERCCLGTLRNPPCRPVFWPQLLKFKAGQKPTISSLMCRDELDQVTVDYLQNLSHNSARG